MSAGDVGHLEEARTRTGTRRRLHMRVSRPCTPIHGRRRQYLVENIIDMVKMKMAVIINVKISEGPQG